MNRKFNWVSSSNPENKKVLDDLNSKMFSFYSQIETRKSYQEMVDHNDYDLMNPGIIIKEFINYLKTLSIEKILDVGCGTGRIYKFINKSLPDIQYTGIELSETIINSNKQKYPHQTWYVADAYYIPVETESNDICFSFYVLEHLVFPEKALNEMLRTVKKGGYVILIFPDFVASEKLASQRIGYSDLESSKQKIRKGKVLDAIVSLFDSRIRLPKSLFKAVSNIGPFPVNINPKCLSPTYNGMSPDVDAVYIASKTEIKNWAIKRGYQVIFPAGETGHFFQHAYISIKKTNG